MSQAGGEKRYVNWLDCPYRKPTQVGEEKILAAKRAGINTIIISEENRKDVEDIKEIYVKGLTFVYVRNIQDVIDAAF